MNRIILDAAFAVKFAVEIIRAKYLPTAGVWLAQCYSGQKNIISGCLAWHTEKGRDGGGEAEGFHWRLICLGRIAIIKPPFIIGDCLLVKASLFHNCPETEFIKRDPIFIV